MQPVDSRQLLQTVACQGLFVSLYGIKTDRLDIIDGGSQSVSGHIVGRTSFKLKRKALKSSSFPRHFVNHLATALIGWQTVEPFFFSVEHTDTRRTVHLMATERIEIAVELLNIHFQVWSTLRTVDEHGDATSMGFGDDKTYGIHRSEHVAHVGEAHQLRAFCQQCFQTVQTELSIV